MNYTRILAATGVAAMALTASAQWPAFFHGTSTTDKNDGANAITLDSVGNVIVAGYAMNAVTEADFEVVKYNRFGSEIWHKKIDRFAGVQSASKVAVDGDDNIVVTGLTNDAGSNFDDILTVKMDENGTVQWSQRYNGPANRSDVVSGLTISGSGDVIITGFTQQVGVSDRDFVTIKYSAAGVKQWAKIYSAGTNSDEGRDV
jgi:hypothetical protein